MAGFIESFDIYGNRRLEYRTELPGLGRPEDAYSVDQAAAFGVYPGQEDFATEAQRSQFQIDNDAQTAAFHALEEANAQAVIVRSFVGDDQASKAQAAYAAAAQKTLTTVVNSATPAAHADIVDKARTAAAGAPRVETTVTDDVPKLSTAPAPEPSPLVLAGGLFAVVRLLFF